MLPLLLSAPWPSVWGFRLFLDDSPVPSFGFSVPTPHPAKLHTSCRSASLFQMVVEVAPFPFLCFCLLAFLTPLRYGVLQFGKDLTWWNTAPLLGSACAFPWPTCLGDLPPRHCPQARVPGRPALHPNLFFLQAQISVRGKRKSMGKSSIIALELRDRLEPRGEAGVDSFAYLCSDCGLDRP